MSGGLLRPPGKQAGRQAGWKAASQARTPAPRRTTLGLVMVRGCSSL